MIILKVINEQEDRYIKHWIKEKLELRYQQEKFSSISKKKGRNESYTCFKQKACEQQRTVKKLGLISKLFIVREAVFPKSQTNRKC